MEFFVRTKEYIKAYDFANVQPCDNIRNSATLTDQRGSYAFTCCSAFTVIFCLQATTTLIMMYKNYCSLFRMSRFFICLKNVFNLIKK